jgi:hypothetical protein
MKNSSANASAEAPSLQTARGFVATNVALPGFGTLMAKRSEGYPQAALTVAGFALTVIFGIRFGIWFFKNLNALYGAQADPLESMISVWRSVRWALLGIVFFVVAWLWSLVSNAAILRSAKKMESNELPPIIR